MLNSCRRQGLGEAVDCGSLVLLRPSNESREEFRLGKTEKRASAVDSLMGIEVVSG